jgi:two-component system response regulator AtoC
VRELKNLLTKAVLKTHGSVLLADTIEQCLGTQPAKLGSEGLSTLEEVEKAHIQKILGQMGWNISATAKALGVSRPTLRKRLKSYRLFPPAELTG